MPGAEAVLLSAMGVATIAMVAFFRRERLRAERGEQSDVHPISIGLIRGCAFVIVLIVAYAVVAITITAITSAHVAELAPQNHVSTHPPIRAHRPRARGTRRRTGGGTQSPRSASC